MNDNSTFENTVPPTSFVDDLLNVLETGDGFALMFAALLLAFVGQQAVQHKPQLRQWGLRCGLLAFVAWFARDLVVHGLWGSEQLLATALRALIVAALTASAAWVVLPVLALLHSTILAPLLRLPWSVASRILRSVVTVRDRRRQARQAQRQRERDALLAPEREQERLAAEEQRRLEREREQVEQTRRDQVRLETNLLCDRYRAELNDTLQADALQKYFEYELSDAHSADEVERRGEQLKQMIRDRLNVNQRQHRPQFESIEAIIEYFRAKKQRLRLLDLEPDTLETMEIALDEAQDRELRKLLT